MLPASHFSADPPDIGMSGHLAERPAVRPGTEIPDNEPPKWPDIPMSGSPHEEQKFITRHSSTSHINKDLR